MNLGEKNEGDNVTCQIEIEFNNVSVTEGQKFRFWTQGGADDKWDIGNPWNYLVSFDTPPEDGIYYFNLTTVLSEKMAQASTFDIGFRCDNWASGSFRVHNVKIEKGDVPTEWTPGL